MLPGGLDYSDAFLDPSEGDLALVTAPMSRREVLEMDGRKEPDFVLL